MSETSSIRLLASLFRPEQDDARPTILLGAGASFSSGIPMAGESVRRIAKRVYAEREQGGKILPEKIKPSEWQTWLHGQSWFLKGQSELAENFPLIIEHLLWPEAYRKKVLMDLVRLEGDVGSGYHSLADLVMRGLAGTILTTNFDICLQQALRGRYPHIRHICEVNRGPDDFNEFDIFARAQIVWLHGKMEQYTDRNVASETEALSPELLARLGPLLDATPLIVVGYRGSEASVMNSMLGEQSGRRFRKGVFWCSLENEPLHENVVQLQSQLGSNFHHIVIDGFDELFDGLNIELANVKRFFDAPAEPDQAGFDDLPTSRASWGDINSDLALATLRQYSEKVGLGELGSDKLKPLMRDLGLLVSTKDGERPSNGAVLLFGRDPQRFFPHAVVSATINNKARQVFSGNLIDQRKTIYEWLESDDVNPTVKLKGKRTHTDQLAYSERALAELLMNLLVHRDYSIEDLASINVNGTTHIEFTNPGGPSADATTRLSLDADGKFEPVPEFSELRNRALCDVFFGMSAMERAGTGLADAAELSRSHGGSASFAFPTGEDRFRAQLFRPEASAGSKSIARSAVPVGTYVVNMLPFSSMPTSLQRAYVPGGWKALEKYALKNDLGQFILDSKTDTFLSFEPVAVLTLKLGAALEGDVEEIPLGEASESEVMRRYVSWLIRRHFEAYLKCFENDGLILEKDDKGRTAKRAYFTGQDGESRILTYNSAKRSNIPRGVAKRREDKRYVWFECEGFGYEVVMTANMWGVRIKPFYMFTKQDGVSPLPGYLRTKKSTWRFKYDRNANVDSDLVFWERFISQAQQAVNIGNGHVDSLLLEGGFLTVEVEEKGLLSDESSAQDKRSA